LNWSLKAAYWLELSHKEVNMLLAEEIFSVATIEEKTDFREITAILSNRTIL
jgi:hypothetical protein